ncbi:hypothetical protein Tco_0022179, partial [Tanacetum coccineum]
MFGYHGDLLVPSFETAGLGPQTDHLSPSYDLLNKGPFFTRSWASRNKMVRSSILGPASHSCTPPPPHHHKMETEQGGQEGEYADGEGDKNERMIVSRI